MDTAMGIGVLNVNEAIEIGTLCLGPIRHLLEGGKRRDGPFASIQLNDPTKGGRRFHRHRPAVAMGDCRHLASRPNGRNR